MSRIKQDSNIVIQQISVIIGEVHSVIPLESMINIIIAHDERLIWVNPEILFGHGAAQPIVELNRIHEILPINSVVEHKDITCHQREGIRFRACINKVLMHLLISLMVHAVIHEVLFELACEILVLFETEGGDQPCRVVIGRIDLGLNSGVRPAVATHHSD